MFEDLLKKIASALAEQGVPYMIIGGQAVLRYGEPRLTKDVDITVGLEPGEAGPVLDVIQKLGLHVLVDDAAAFLKQTFVLPAAEPETGIRIDFVFALSPYEREAIANSLAVNMGGVEVRFVSPEDLIVHKIAAGRPRDLEDVRTVLLKHPGLDHRHIRKWLAEYDAELGEGFEERFLEIVRACGTGS